MKHPFWTVPLIAGLLAPGLFGQSKTAQPPKEQGMTREQGDAILKELRSIRELLEKQGARPAAPAQAGDTVSVRIENGQVLGNKNAPLTMVEFTDYQCPYCRSFYVSTFSEIRKKYIDTGMVRFVSRDMPLDFHPNAMRAAEAGRCAADQGKYWEMRDLMAADPRKLSEEDLTGYATKLGLALPAFKSCVTGGKHRQDIQRDMADAASLGINGTPSFVVGRSTPQGVDGEVVVGAQPFAAFDAKFQQLRGQN